MINTMDDGSGAWLQALRRYLWASGLFHLAWEIVQLPLYQIWAEPLARQAFAVAHCTLGDLMIAGLSLLGTLALVGDRAWPRRGTFAVWLLLVVFGVSYTMYSEWLNVSVRGNWAYAPLMPTLPWIGTGVSPLLQWIVVPSLALAVTRGRGSLMCDT